MVEPILIDWNDEKRSEFRRGVMTARHRLQAQPEFSDYALAQLIDRHPHELCDICTMGEDPSDRASWRAGERGHLTGLDLMQAVREGRLWINLREAMNLDPVYRPFHRSLMAQLRRLNPGYRPTRSYGGILISSPTAQAFYHADVSETLMLHVKGRKRVRVYPPHAPWLTERSMEAVLHREQGEDIPFDRCWDKDAMVVDLTPGSFVSWPLHAPHRVENLGEVCVSVICEVVTHQSMMKNAVLHANGALRRLGFKPRSTRATGPEAYAKLALSKAWRLGVRLSGGAVMPPKIDTTFEVDPAAHAGFRDRAAA